MPAWLYLLVSGSWIEFLESATSGTSVKVSGTSSDTLTLCHPGANHTDACSGGQAGSSWLAGRAHHTPSASHLSRDTVWGTDTLGAGHYPETVLGSLSPPKMTVVRKLMQSVCPTHQAPGRGGAPSPRLA